MNIIVEGIDGTGKTTLINDLIFILEKESYSTCYIKEIEDSPLKPILDSMLEDDPFFNKNKEFSTSIYETFILAANFFYKQEYFRDSNKDINIYDRDFLTILCYQKIILAKDYGNKSQDFYDHFVKCIMFDLKKVDLLIYMDIPLEISFERVESRDKMIMTKNQKEFLKESKQLFESVLLPMLSKHNVNILYLNYDSTPKNMSRVIKEIKKCVN